MLKANFSAFLVAYTLGITSPINNNNKGNSNNLNGKF